MTNCCISYVSVLQLEYSTSSSTSKSALRTVSVSRYCSISYHNNSSVRRIWFWRHSALIFTGFTCFFCGGILSEFVQAALPFKQFEWGDVLANLLGSSLGLYVAYHLERYYRHRREIARLYRPLSGSVSDFEEEEDDEDESMGTQLLPTHHVHNTLMLPFNQKARLADVWDERDEVFDIGVDSDEEHDVTTSVRQTQPTQPGPPQIVVSHA